ncbi:NAD-dependent dihydropyrimidine dehydrogenase subunit PreT, partial [human gut metagenome]
QNYLDELTPAFTPLLAIKEASRCLLCHDAPCSQACPAQTDPGKFIRSIFDPARDEPILLRPGDSVRVQVAP